MEDKINKWKWDGTILSTICLWCNKKTPPQEYAICEKCCVSKKNHFKENYPDLKKVYEFIESKKE